MAENTDNADEALINSPLGPLRFRPERSEDEAFRFVLFCESRPDLALLPAPARDAILPMQFRAQAQSYRSQFPQARYDIVELAGEPIGRLVRDYSDGAVNLVDIAISAQRRGRGAGTAILYALMDEARSANLSIRLRVIASNRDAARLYRRLGFSPMGSDGMHDLMEWRAAPAVSDTVHQ